ncbi:dicarboxylate/amino acid:cation symporter [Boudabousia marimammalium]|uniref:Sodium:proton antiporter n=1 Tax=Boudabousia marimammalium TaxID=156892 RepID=A0A1Q5PP85_9ACTO|nr:dicarboxylate/amino acid:cation symporter [Boudabousia marimammalium]OKL49329.1 sodium:proton antiporter [Boudabousia marimammalium]
MKMPKISLVVWVFLAIVAGVLLGLVMPDWFVRIFVTFSKLFGQFLGFAIPLIIVGLVAPAIGELGKGAGKWLVITAGIAYTSTFAAGLLTYLTGSALFPFMLSSGSGLGSVKNPDDVALAPYFEIEMPPVFGVMTALLLAFLLGIGVTLVKTQSVARGLNEFRTIVIRMIETIIIPLLPLHVMGIFMNLTYSGEAWVVIKTFLAVVVWTMTLTFVMLIVQYGIAGAFTARNPFKALWNMRDAYFTALGTSSSAATIPVTLGCVKRNRVSDSIASFVVPLCATIHLSGSMIKITGFSMAILWITGSDMSLSGYIGFILMLGVFMIAAPGVPGGAIAAAAGLLTTMLGFNDVQVGLMFATYIALDSVGTATNVTGDGAIAMIVNKIAAGRLEAGVKLEHEAELDADDLVV